MASLSKPHWRYIPQFRKPPSKVKFFFDVYDVEEGLL
jgi:hypothetical protein